jgi:sulfide:quinone oxidoreductase
VTVFTPLPMSLPILGSAGCSVIEDRLAGAGIKFLASHTAVRVEANKVAFSNGTHLDFDLLLGVAPHRAPEVVRRCRLTEGGDWVPVDTETLETRYPGVFAIGDVNLVKMANGKPLPKAGVFAEAQGKVVAQRILETLAGNQPAAIFEGIGGCFLEIDSQNAVKIEGHFLAKPEPQVLLTDASPKLLEEKRQFEKERLVNWLK